MATVVALAGGTGTASAAPTTSTPTPKIPSLDQIPGLDQAQTMLEELLRNFGMTLPDGKNADPVASTGQMIMVTAPQASSTTATLTAFEKNAEGVWKPVIGPAPAYLGEKGLGKAEDNVYRTPEGTFALDQAFGRKANPGTKMPYFQSTTQDWWDANPKSPTYNQHVKQAQSPGGDSENLYNMGPVYDYAVNIAHNPQNIPGNASAIFLHVSDGKPTWGCVSTPLETMVSILKWLDPAKNPKITIGVNVDAPKDTEPATSGTTTPSTGQGSSVVDSLTALIPTLLGALTP